MSRLGAGARRLKLRDLGRMFGSLKRRLCMSFGMISISGISDLDPEPDTCEPGIRTSPAFFLVDRLMFHKTGAPKKVKRTRSFHLLKNVCSSPLLALKRTYHYWTYVLFSKGLNQMEGGTGKNTLVEASGRTTRSRHTSKNRLHQGYVFKRGNGQKVQFACGMVRAIPMFCTEFAPLFHFLQPFCIPFVFCRPKCRGPNSSQVFLSLPFRTRT